VINFILLEQGLPQDVFYGKHFPSNIVSAKASDSIATKSELSANDAPLLTRGDTPQNLMNAGIAITVLITVIALIRALTDLVKVSRED
jgi:hypothetical protein